MKPTQTNARRHGLTTLFRKAVDDQNLLRQRVEYLKMHDHGSYIDLMVSRSPECEHIRLMLSDKWLGHELLGYSEAAGDEAMGSDRGIGRYGRNNLIKSQNIHSKGEDDND